MASSCAAGERLFSVVPEGDATYSQLHKLEDLGLVPEGAAGHPLTRYDVAQLVFKAETAFRERYPEVLLAQAAPFLFPPPPEESDQTEQEALEAERAALAAEAQKAITNLQEAYQAELKALRRDVTKLSDRVRQSEEARKNLERKVRNLEHAPGIYLHGLGRAFTDTRLPGHRQSQRLYLDLRPVAVVSPEIRWEALVRIGSSLMPPNSSDDRLLKRITLEFRPSWFSATLGDLDESYTPLTLWNRDGRDLLYEPEMSRHQREVGLYESYLDRAPALPFRGARLGASFRWPDPALLGSWDASTFAHMIRSGYDNDSNVFDGYSAWILGARTAVRARKYLQVEACGLMLDEPLDSDEPYSVYEPLSNTTNARTWAHRYVIAGVRPRLEVETMEGLTVGGQVEAALSEYQDDKRDAARKTRDSAWRGGPFVKYRDSDLQFNFVDNGPYYFSPLAQLRQTDDLLVSMGEDGLLPHPFLSGLPRPAAIYRFYSRLWDNTFPYGPATPNRKGCGLEADLKYLSDPAFRLKSSVYRLRESSDWVLDPGTTPYAPAAGVWPGISRRFLYVNVGPRVTLYPWADRERRLEFGFNVRTERTESSLGVLKSDQVLVGLLWDALSWAEWEVSGYTGGSRGREVGYNGLPVSRYLVNDADGGGYAPLDVDHQEKGALAAVKVRVSGNSRFYLDVGKRWVSDIGTGWDDSVTGNGYYEIEF